MSMTLQIRKFHQGSYLLKNATFGFEWRAAASPGQFRPKRQIGGKMLLFQVRILLHVSTKELSFRYSHLLRLVFASHL